MLSRSRFLRFVVLPFAVLGSLGAGVAVAGGHFGPPGPDMHHAMVMNHLEQVADELGLSDDQVTQIRAILDDAHAQGEALRASHEDLRTEGIALFTAETIDRQAIEDHRQDMLLAANEGTMLMADTMAAVAEVLTPEQRLAAAEKMEEFHADGGWRGRMHKRFGHGR